MLLSDPTLRWTRRDLALMVSIAFTFAWVFLAWDALYDVLLGPLGLPLAVTSLINGVWFLAGFVGMAVVRKPGACLFTEALAALLEVLFASWFLGGYPIDVLGEAYTHIHAVTPTALVHGTLLGQIVAGGETRFVTEFAVFNMVWFVGLLEGLAPEVVFGFAQYRSWRLPVWLAAAVAGAAIEWVTGIYVTQYYLYMGIGQTLLTLPTSAIGIGAVAGGGGYLLAQRSLGRTPAANRGT